MIVADNFAPSKIKLVDVTLQDWFDFEITEKNNGKG